MASAEDIDDADDSPPGSPKDSALFKPKPKPKAIRVLTVLAYILSVSMAAILLSIYYIFMWDGQPHLGASRSYEGFNGSLASRMVEAVEYRSLEEEGEEDGASSPAAYFYSTVDVDFNGTEIQQLNEITAIEEEVFVPTASAAAEENTTWPDSYNFSSDLGRTSTFVKKLVHDEYPYAEND